jgi:hypothetical protein
MTEAYLRPEERQTLLKLARQAMEFSVRGEPAPPLDLEALPPRLRTDGASFVTLTKAGQLRGCIGTLEARQPLAVDVRKHAVDAALKDFRFPPVQPEELGAITIEISYLTTPQPLQYQGPDDLVSQLNPGEDGLVLKDGFRRATFLPQVWDKLPTPEEFLSHLCQKMGASPDLWQRKPLDVFTYQVEKFSE